MQERLLAEFAIEVPIIPWPAPPRRLLRISAQLYYALPQYERLAEALTQFGRLANRCIQTSPRASAKR